ncbi:hypothetical protein AB834_04940 [PVC group bacterium (ex Bugula neritina AB1)]|nr:hypothetical protein AB834_04940 [PVC group bacterium (ex Bugula neritina AB1)]
MDPMSKRGNEKAKGTTNRRGGNEREEKVEIKTKAEEEMIRKKDSPADKKESRGNKRFLGVLVRVGFPEE